LPEWPGAAAKDYVRSHGLKVADVMTRDPITVAENAPLDEVVRIMESYNIKRLPVIRRSKIVDIVEPCRPHARTGVYRSRNPGLGR
jgi:CBS domain-containing protein